MTSDPLLSLRPSRLAGRPRGVTSVCTAHPEVIGATLALGAREQTKVLIEATCNQVNQDGGYTGMTPAGFRDFVLHIAAQERFDPAGLILGGDHLGPNPWKHLAPEAAMDKALVMTAAYVRAGFTKIHLDASMACAGDPAVLPEATIAERAARMAAVAEATARDESLPPPVYVIGTEVPVPGGATEALDHIAVTTPASARETLEVHEKAFARLGLSAALDRVIALVVQPGVEFGNDDVSHYDPAAALALTAELTRMPLVYEAHSTDYQPQETLAALVRDGFAILKVGPELTFALRRSLYGLDRIAEELTGPRPGGTLPEVMERLMQAEPKHWRPYCSGDAASLRQQRHSGFSDRIRYYWPQPEAEASVAALMAALGDRPIPEALIARYLPDDLAETQAGTLPPEAASLRRAGVTRVLQRYSSACLG